MLKIYVEQLEQHRRFLREHPHGASSWNDTVVIRLLAHPGVHTTFADQNAYGLATPDADGQPMPAKKPTMFASSSPQMLARLGEDAEETTNISISWKGAAPPRPSTLRLSCNVERHPRHSRRRRPSCTSTCSCPMLAPTFMFIYKPVISNKDSPSST